jgi:hypothetical protein
MQSQPLSAMVGDVVEGMVYRDTLVEPVCRRCRLPIAFEHAWRTGRTCALDAFEHNVKVAVHVHGARRIFTSSRFNFLKHHWFWVMNKSEDTLDGSHSHGALIEKGFAVLSKVHDPIELSSTATLHTATPIPFNVDNATAV